MSPFFLDMCLNELDRDRSFSAVVQPAIRAQAEEVHVLSAVTVDGSCNAEAAATGSAEHTSLEIVVVYPLVLPSGVVVLQNVLDLLEYLVGHQSGVRSLVLHTVATDDAHVVGIAQHAVEGGTRNRLLADHRARHCGESLVGQRLGEGAQCPVTRAVRLEGPSHQGGTDWIHFNGPDLTAVHDVTNVQVTDWRLADCSPLLHFLKALGLDFLGEIGGIPLGDEGHEPMSELACRAGVDVLGTRHQLDPGFLQGQGDHQVIHPVASQAVDLVDDQVVNGLLRHESKHALQLGAVGRPCRLSGVNELGHD